jgi:magnesium-protoporphyrin IX monomethyl ester (oxidative) cyclase
LKKILLIYPPILLSKTERPAITTPIGVAYVAAVAERAGFSVTILDSLAEGEWKSEKLSRDLYYWGLSYKEIKERIEAEKPDLVGIGCQFTLQYMPSKEIARIVKEVDPKIVTVMGGTHSTVMCREILEKEPYIDYVVRSEGEYAFTDLLERLRDGRPIDDIDGFAFRKDGVVHLNEKRQFIANLDDLPFPARHLLRMDVYGNTELKRGWGINRRAPKANMITSRGCPFDCSFCGIALNTGKKMRGHSPEYVVAEIEELISKYGIKEVHFEDDNLTLNKQRSKQIFDLIVEKGLDISWAAPSGLAIWTFNDDVLEKMKASGCYRVNLGLESGSDHVLKKIIKKPITTKTIREKIALVKKHGLEITGFWVIGMPGETRSQMWETLDFASSLGLDDNQVAVALPYPGTELYDTCKEKGYLAFNQKDEKSYEHFSISSALIRTPDFTPTDVIAIRDAGRFFAIIKKAGRAAIPGRVIELFKRNGLGGFKVAWVVLKKYFVS